MKLLTLALLVFCLTGCVETDVETHRPMKALQQSMKECKRGTIVYSASLSNDGVSWYTMRCTAPEKHK